MNYRSHVRKELTVSDFMAIDNVMKNRIMMLKKLEGCEYYVIVRFSEKKARGEFEEICHYMIGRRWFENIDFRKKFFATFQITGEKIMVIAEVKNNKEINMSCNDREIQHELARAMHSIFGNSYTVEITV